MTSRVIVCLKGLGGPYIEPPACPFHPLPCLSHIILTTIWLCILTKGNTSFNKFFSGQPMIKCHTQFILFIGTSHHDFHGYLVIKFLSYIMCVYFDTYLCVMVMFTQSSALFSFACPWAHVYSSIVVDVWTSARRYMVWILAWDWYGFLSCQV
jgi:hypothetical protein